MKPDGTPQMVTIADPRQLNDAPFNAGTNSGSEYEYVDNDNRLHFYIIDVRKDADGVVHYKVAVRSLDGAGPQTRGVRLATPVPGADAGFATCTFGLTNTGVAAATPNVHPQDARAFLDGDVYRLRATRERHRLVGAAARTSWRRRSSARRSRCRSTSPRAPAPGSVTLQATSESDPSKSDGGVAARARDVGGTVPATLSLTTARRRPSGRSRPGVARDYTATMAANVISTAGDATLSVADPCTTATGQPGQRRVLAGRAAAGQGRQRRGHGRATTPVGSPRRRRCWPTPARRPTTP